VKNISKAEVKDTIFGYTIANDVTARDLQRTHVQWVRGKSLDTFCPLGPVIVTKDEINYPPALAIESRVNGEVRQQSTTDHLIFDLDTIIAQLSQGMTLYPGDIILTGTPSGVGMGFTPPKYLKSGDVVECEIEKIGILRNTMA
jgi:2-keto-4-pentenoate hydratase/2-oxohepta-3-ene-1,7-dioic acid hydratase in catechol pathway